MATNRTKCFVIMPFSKTTDLHTGEYWTNHFSKFLKPLIEENTQLEAIRSEPLRGNILNQIIRELYICKIVVADLTDENPNVYWELGVRQSFKHGTITIAEDGTKPPFDIFMKGVLNYFPHDHVQNEEFRDRFGKALVDCLVNPNSPDSYVLETISGRGSLFEIINREQTLRRLEGLLSEAKHNSLAFSEICKGLEEGGLSNFRFRTCSLEDLIANRYLDADDKFYEIAEVSLDTGTSMNHVLVNYAIDNVAVEKMFLDQKEDMQKLFDSLVSLVAAKKGKLATMD